MKYIIALVVILGTAGMVHNSPDRGTLEGPCFKDGTCNDDLVCSNYSFTNIACSTTTVWYCGVAPDMGAK